jgi:YegS/Rv2252/BmrU family lipid kinase
VDSRIDNEVRTRPDPHAGPSAPRRALLLVNRHARSGTSALDDVVAVLRRGGVEVVMEQCSSRRPIPDAIREQARSFDCIVLGGGDGTLNAAAPALIETGLPFGILPLGTANDLARTLGIEPDPVAAAGLILAGNTRRIDLGEVNGRPFFNVASIGFSAELARELTAEAKRKWGVLGYALTALRLLVTLRPFRAYLEHDGVVDRSLTVQVSVGNGRHYGGGMTVDAAAEPDDGRLYVWSLEVSRWWQLLALFPALRRGRQKEWKEVRAFRTTALTVRTRRTRRVNTDGELTTQTPARFRLLRQALSVYAPVGIVQTQTRPT